MSDHINPNGDFLAVIIPYYQEEKGILSRAVLSALNQEGYSNFNIIIVDDASPVPAQSEIGDLIFAHPGRITIIERENGGAGAARNTALDSLPEEQRFVAFLDSDDEWEPHHLATAVAVLERGYDCYFSNLYNTDEELSAFEKEEKIQFPTRLRPEELRPLDGLADCCGFRGDMFDRVLFSGNLIMLTTFAYDFSKFRRIRFLEEFRLMGEDYLFFAMLSASGAKFGFSLRAGARRGSGVNIFDKSGWGSPRYLSRLCDEMAFRNFVTQTWKLSDRQCASVEQKLLLIREHFTATLAGRLVRLEFKPLLQFIRFLHLDPVFLACFPVLLFRYLWKKFY